MFSRSATSVRGAERMGDVDAKGADYKKDGEQDEYVQGNDDLGVTRASGGRRSRAAAA